APDAAGNAALRERLGRLTRLDPRAPADQAVLAAYALLAQAPSTVLLATLEDLLGVERRPNLPGTTPDRWPSWSIPLPATLEAIRELPRARRLAALLARR